MIDYDFNPYLIEMNSTPAFLCETEVQKRIIPKVIK